MLKNIEKNIETTLIKINNYIHLEIIINKIE